MICIVVGRCMYLVVTFRMLCVFWNCELSLTGKERCSSLHIFAFNCSVLVYDDCFCLLLSCYWYTYMQRVAVASFILLIFTFYSRFLCSWLKIMCSVSLLSFSLFVRFCYLLTFLAFISLLAISIKWFRASFAFLFFLSFCVFIFIRSSFLLLITQQCYCYIKASQANGLTCTSQSVCLRLSVSLSISSLLLHIHRQIFYSFQNVERKDMNLCTKYLMVFKYWNSTRRNICRLNMRCVQFQFHLSYKRNGNKFLSARCVMNIYFQRTWKFSKIYRF